MADTIRLPFYWLNGLNNAHHDGTTQMIDDIVQVYDTDNQVFLQMRESLHQARIREDEVWLTTLRDQNVPLLSAANKRLDCYATATRYAIMAHSVLPSDEPTKSDGERCEQVFKDFKFSTRESMGAESDKIIQMYQNLQPFEAYLTQIGAWQFLVKAEQAAREVRRLLAERATFKGEFVRGDMRAARKQTDKAIGAIYDVIEAMMRLMPSESLTNLYNQLKGIEIYARQYYLSPGAVGAGVGAGNGEGDNSGSGEGGNGTGEGENQGAGTGTGSGTGENPGGGTGNDSGNGGTGGGGTGDDSGNGGTGGGNYDDENGME